MIPIRTHSLKQVYAGIVHGSNHLLFVLKRAMEFRDRVAIVGSETKVYQVQFLSAVSVRVTEKNIFWLDVAMDDMSRVQVLEDVQLRESSESYLSPGTKLHTIWFMSNKPLLRL